MINKKGIKKNLAIGLAAAMMLSATACGSTNNESTTIQDAYVTECTTVAYDEYPEYECTTTADGASETYAPEMTSDADYNQGDSREYNHVADNPFIKTADEWFEYSV